MNEEQHYVLRLTCMPDSRPGIIRIRSLLKLMLRGFRIRCDGIQSVDGLSGQAEDIDATQGRTGDVAR